jgi:hypothetical protein
LITGVVDQDVTQLMPLGKYRWVVEQTFALLHWFRRLRIRWEIRDDIHEAFLRLGAPSSVSADWSTCNSVRSSQSNAHVSDSDRVPAPTAITRSTGHPTLQTHPPRPSA